MSFCQILLDLFGFVSFHLSCCSLHIGRLVVLCVYSDTRQRTEIRDFLASGLLSGGARTEACFLMNSSQKVCVFFVGSSVLWRRLLLIFYL